MAAFLVLYYFQSEPGESIDSPNAFSIPKGANSNITFGQFLDRFPASSGKGRLHYRFRSDDNICGYVWLDISDRAEIVPVSAGVVTCKILCVDNCFAIKRFSRLKLKANLDSGEEGAAVMRSKRLNQEKRSITGGSDRSNGIGTAHGRNPDRYVENDDNNHGNPFPEDDSYGEEDDFQKAPVYSEAPRNDVSSGYNSGKGALPRKSSTVDNLLDNDDSPVASSVINRSPSATLTPVIQRTPSVGNPSTPKSYVTPTPAPVVEQEQDMFHFDAADSKTSTGGKVSSATSDAHLSRAELVNRREAAVDEKVKEALEFKQELDENNKREAEELEAARTKHEKSLLAWSTNNKEKRNVRTLLTTMHTVLWTGKGNTWKTISLGDVIEPKQVKLQYRKAMLVVHPDRCSALSTEIKFIAKRIFEGINEAYQEFLKKESV